MEKGIRIADLFGNEQEYIGKKALVQGWVRTKRDSKAGISFIELNDGSSLKSLQVIAEGRPSRQRKCYNRGTAGLGQT